MQVGPPYQPAAVYAPPSTPQPHLMWAGPPPGPTPPPSAALPPMGHPAGLLFYFFFLELS